MTYSVNFRHKKKNPYYVVMNFRRLLEYDEREGGD